MTASNVFKMELFKNINDKTSIIIASVLMISNSLIFLFPDHFWNWLNLVRYAFAWGITFASFLFLYFYPFQLARLDYRNNVMSLLIASGMSRTQYYFIKVGSLTIFSVGALIVVYGIPLFLSSLMHPEGFAMAVSDTVMYISFQDVAAFVYVFFLWLSTIACMLTSVIITRGKFYSLFIFFGISWFSQTVTTVVTGIIVGIMGMPAVITVFDMFGYQEGIVMVVMIISQIVLTFLIALLGLLISKKQNL